ncbi:pyridoxal 5'-phosphate synthase [Cryptosporangium sp. NPDC048952]|uniref:pyridoxine/pyridoxamine 5'-phosphate oxidase n=1 Tax=Cryptosporangium sp. NPDC048952 TaxID=3363961 RepID=UPI003714A185
MLDWLRVAIAHYVPEPYAVTLSTIGADGCLDARVLVLKDVSDDAVCEIATGDRSAKGRQLAANPACALSVYWSPLARAVRLRGVAERASAATAAADFRARALEARVLALAGRQSAPLPGPAERDRLLADARQLLEAQPDLVDPGWTVWRVRPVSVEFWQGDPSRHHLRLRYDRTEVGWNRSCLWA